MNAGSGSPTQAELTVHLLGRTTLYAELHTHWMQFLADRRPTELSAVSGDTRSKTAIAIYGGSSRSVTADFG